jgi:hypothetical protein
MAQRRSSPPPTPSPTDMRAKPVVRFFATTYGVSIYLENALALTQAERPI